MSAADWSNSKVRAAWFTIYAALQTEGREYYFSNYSGLKRCFEDAQAGRAPGPEHWALFVAERMKG